MRRHRHITLVGEVRRMERKIDELIASDRRVHRMMHKQMKKHKRR